MNYNEALEFIHSTNKFGMILGLDSVKTLLNLLGTPQNNLKFIHIAGTNGKGSTSALVHNVLKEQGYKVGLFISPFLEEFTERIQISGEHIRKEELAGLTERVKEAIDVMVSKGLQHPTEFEVVTAIGFLYFAQKQVDFVVLEVGLGGRLDATNVISKAEVSIISSIGFDHMAQLGNTLQEIASEKAGIIKEKGRVVVYPQSSEVHKVIQEKAREKAAEHYIAEEESITLLENSLGGQMFSYDGISLSLPRVEMKLLGKHQILNAATALKAIEVLRDRGNKIDEDAILKGIKNTQWAGRFEIVSNSPVIILDGAHNIQGVEALSEALRGYFPQRKVTFLLGILQDKQTHEMLQILLPLAKEMITLTPDNPRAMAGKDLEKQVLALAPTMKCRTMDTIQEAVEWAKNSDPKEIIAFTGSLYMIGEVRKTIVR